MIPVLLVVWSIIIYRIFHVVNGNEKKQFDNGSKILAADSGISLPDTFSISGNYRDPFDYVKTKRSNEMSKAQLPAVQSSNPDKKETAIVTVKASITWPLIEFSGIIKNNGSNKQFALIQINGTSTIMKQGDLKEAVELIRLTKDSVEVKFQTEIKWIKNSQFNKGYN